MPGEEPGSTTFEGGLVDWPLLLLLVLGAGLLVAAPFLEASDAEGGVLAGTLCLTVSVPLLTLLTHRRVTIDRDGVEIATIFRKRLAWEDLTEVGVAPRGPKLYFAERGRTWRLRGVYARDFQARQALLAIADLMAKSRPDFARLAHDHAVRIARGRTPTAPERWLRRWGYWLSLGLLAVTAAVWVIVLV